MKQRQIESTRVIRGRPAGRDVFGWEQSTAAERLEAVWDLTLVVAEWAGNGESRLHRSACRIQRSCARALDYLVVGAYALAFHGHVRATKDLDVWVRPESANARKVFRALQAFGAPTGELTEEEFAKPDITFQIGVAPIRIDGLSSQMPAILSREPKLELCPASDRARAARLCRHEAQIEFFVWS